MQSSCGHESDSVVGVLDSWVVENLGLVNPIGVSLQNGKMHFYILTWEKKKLKIQKSKEFKSTRDLLRPFTNDELCYGTHPLFYTFLVLFFLFSFSSLFI